MRSSSPLSRVLLLTVLFVVLAVAPSLAANSSSAVSLPGDAPGVQAGSPATAAFLATLATDLSGTPGVLFASGCTSSSQCPKGQLCCYACGASDCETRACFQPVNGHCPLFQ
jgi:hypothetical protein